MQMWDNNNEHVDLDLDQCPIRITSPISIPSPIIEPDHHEQYARSSLFRTSLPRSGSRVRSSLSRSSLSRSGSRARSSLSRSGSRSLSDHEPEHRTPQCKRIAATVQATRMSKYVPRMCDNKKQKQKHISPTQHILQTWAQ